VIIRRRWARDFPADRERLAANRRRSAINEHGTIMPGVRRPQRAIDAERRNREQQARLGADIQAMRERRGWTRMELASRAGLGRMVESRIERGIGNPDLDALQRIAAALDRPFVVSFGGRDPSETTADAGHLAIQERPAARSCGRLHGLLRAAHTPD